MFIKMKAICILSFLACMYDYNTVQAKVIVKEDISNAGPIWVAEENDTQVVYPDTSCGKLSKSVILHLADDANVGALKWEKMNDEFYRNQVFREECEKLQYEMKVKEGR